MITIDDLLTIIKVTGVVDRVDNIKTSESFKDNGIDSLDVYTILLAIEEKYNLKFTDEQVVKLTTIDIILSYLNQHNAN